MEVAVAGIKALELSALRMEQIETAIGGERGIAGKDQTGETSAGFIQQPSAAGDDQAQVIAGDGDVIQFCRVPSHPVIEQPPGWIVRRLRRRRKLPERIGNRVRHE